MSRDSARLPPLDLLVSFEAAARRLSFTLAAEERFITQSAMSRQIRALEDELGVALFKRRHRALELTDDGLRLHAACASVLSQLRQVVAQIRAPARRQVLSLTTTPGLAALWLIPRLPLFTQAHPGIDVRLDTSLAARDLEGDGFDLAIRYVPSTHPEGVPLFAESMLPVCSAKLLRSGPPLKTAADLRAHTLLVMADPSRGAMPMEWEVWLNAVGLPDLQAKTRLSFSSYGDVIAAAVAGQGVALGRRPLVDGLLRRKQLVSPFKDALASSRAYFLIVEPGARTKPAVHALEQWLLDQAALSASNR